MTIDDREILADMRHRLHGIALALSSLDDMALGHLIEEEIDKIINMITKKLRR